MGNERKIIKDVSTVCMGLYASYRANAMESVAKGMKLTFEPLAVAAQKYGDHGAIVPDNMVYVSLDAGERDLEFWKKVDEIAPPPTPEEIASGTYLR